jgi:hypothetical protein
MSDAHIIVTDSGRFYEDGQEAFDRLMTEVGASAAPKLMLFVHGGLVSEADGRDGAAFLHQALTPTRPDWTSGYLVWRSGLAEILGVRHERLAQNRLFNRLVAKTLARVSEHVVAPGIAATVAALAETDLEAAMAAAEAAPVRTAAEVRADLESKGEAERTDYVEDLTEEQLNGSAIAAYISRDAELSALIAAAGAEPDELLDREIIDEIDARTIVGPGSAGDRATAAGPVILYHVVRAAYRVLRRFVTERDHGLGPTVVEEVARELYLASIGAWVWGTMKSDMRRHFDRDGPGTALLDRVDALARSGKETRLMIVAHSAGSVFACHLAQRAARLSGNLLVELVFLAPAVRMDEAVELLVEQPARIDKIRHFALGDHYEKTDNLKPTSFGRIYSRSLLYLVSGVFERTPRGRSYADAPIAGMERHFRVNAHHTAEETAVRRRFRGLIAGQNPDRLVLSVTGASTPAGHRSTAETHGGFYRDDDTCHSLIHLMLHGFD